MSAEECKQPPGTYVPVVDRGSCEAKRECVAACPYSVFEVRAIDASDFAALSFLGKLRSRVHGRLSAYTPRAPDCRACGKCVTACPENAIRLQRVGA